MWLDEQSFFFFSFLFLNLLIHIVLLPFRLVSKVDNENGIPLIFSKNR